MKKIILLVLFSISATLLIAGSSQTSSNQNPVASQLRSQFTIDMYDTVVFDISQATMAGNQVSFPVYLISDDTINALDFSLGFDEGNFSFDSIINLTTYLQPVYNYTMGTLYLTSYSLQEIEHELPLVSLRFNMLGHYLCSDDLNSLLVYLNGDPCSVKVVECLSDGIQNPDERELMTVHAAFGSSAITMEANENASVQLYDLKGSIMSPLIKIQPGGHTQINTADLPAGIYLLQINGSHFMKTKKIAIGN